MGADLIVMGSRGRDRAAHRLRAPLPRDRRRIGNLCEIGNGSILMPGAVLGDGCIRLNL